MVKNEISADRWAVCQCDDGAAGKTIVRPRPLGEVRPTARSATSRWRKVDPLGSVACPPALFSAQRGLATLGITPTDRAEARRDGT